jgi:hypothetical protein
VEFPCVVCATIVRAFPSGVRGPVHFPPCILHRPFAIPRVKTEGRLGARQGLPERARASHRGARFGSPRRLPFRSGPVPPPGRPADRAAAGSAGRPDTGLSHAITSPPPGPAPLSPRARSHGS